MMKPQNSPVVFLTGASQGIGKEIALHLATRHCSLILCSRSQKKLSQLKSELLSLNPDCKVVITVADVSKPEEVSKAVQIALSHFSAIDILINNAGIGGMIAPLVEQSFESISHTIDVNLKGPIYLMQQILPGMLVQKSGTIININSIAGKTTFPTWGVYSASKFGLRAITEAVSHEVRKQNIRLVNLYSGAVDSPIWDPLESSINLDRKKMLNTKSIAEAIEFIINQPQSNLISELTLEPLIPPL